MSNKKRILLIGSANMDLTMNMYKLPEAGEALIDDAGVAYTPGGRGANGAIALTKLGAQCIFSTKLGADAHGQKLYGYYKEMGIDASYVMVDRDYPTGLSVVIKESDGSVRKVIYPGASANITTEQIVEAFNCNPDALYLTFEIPYAMAVAAAKIASTKNIPVFVAASPSNKEHALEALPPVEIVCVNEREAFEYTGVMPTNINDSLHACITMFRRCKCKYVVIKQGAKGAFLYDGKHYDTLHAIRASSKVVDLAGAGDTFNAALATEYFRNGKNIKGAIVYANAAAAIAISRKGAAASIPTDEEVNALLRK
jgi:ribokinase